MSTAKPIILSLKDNKFKTILYHHFRLLGTKRDRDPENEAQHHIYEDLIGDTDYGEDGPTFYKLRDNQRVPVTREKAMECKYVFYGAVNVIFCDTLSNWLFL